MRDDVVVEEGNRVARLVAFVWIELVCACTAWLPDVRLFQRLRGALVGIALKRCGRRFLLGKDVTIAYPTSVTVGDDVWIGRGAWIMGFGGVTFEDEAMLGPYVCIVAATHSSLDNSYRFGPPRAAPIVIGKGAWIGAHAVVVPGVTIGAGASVTACTLVAVDVPAAMMGAGVPARVIKTPEPRAAVEQRPAS